MNYLLDYYIHFCILYFQVRSTAAAQFTLLGDIVILDSDVDSPRNYLLKVLLKAPLPIWSPTGTVRGISYKITLQCSEFFELLCNLIDALSKSEQIELNLDPVKLLEDELGFLCSSDSTGPVLLLGHLKFMNTLFTFEEIDKRTLGLDFIQYLFDDFLFAASKVANSNATLSSVDLMLELNASCSEPLCRKEAFNLLVTLADGCPENLCDISKQLVDKHHQSLNSKEWDVSI